MSEQSERDDFVKRMGAMLMDTNRKLMPPAYEKALSTARRCKLSADGTNILRAVVDLTISESMEAVEANKAYMNKAVDDMDAHITRYGHDDTEEKYTAFVMGVLASAAHQIKDEAGKILDEIWADTPARLDATDKLIEQWGKAQDD